MGGWVLFFFFFLPFSPIFGVAVVNFVMDGALKNPLWWQENPGFGKPNGLTGQAHVTQFYRQLCVSCLMACKWVHMKKNRSQWSMSNPAGNALCYRDAENACSQHASPMLAASSEGLPCRGRMKAACHMGPSGGLTGFVGQKGQQGTPGTQLSSYLLHMFLPCILMGLAFWIVFFPLEDSEFHFLPLRT